MELLLDRFEKHVLYHDTEASDGAPGVVSGTSTRPRSEALQDDNPDEGLCAVCMQDEVTNSNSIVFCDICNVGVHQVNDSAAGLLSR